MSSPVSARNERKKDRSEKKRVTVSIEDEWIVTPTVQCTTSLMQDAHRSLVSGSTGRPTHLYRITTQGPYNAQLSESQYSIIAPSVAQSLSKVHYRA